VSSTRQSSPRSKARPITRLQEYTNERRLLPSGRLPKRGERKCRTRTSSAREAAPSWRPTACWIVEVFATLAKSGGRDHLRETKIRGSGIARHPEEHWQANKSRAYHDALKTREDAPQYCSRSGCWNCRPKRDFNIYTGKSRQECQAFPRMPTIPEEEIRQLEDSIRDPNSATLRCSNRLLDHWAPRPGVSRSCRSGRLIRTADARGGEPGGHYLRFRRQINKVSTARRARHLPLHELLNGTRPSSSRITSLHL